MYAYEKERREKGGGGSESPPPLVRIGLFVPQAFWAV
jgi:hypothetical protein